MEIAGSFEFEIQQGATYTVELAGFEVIALNVTKLRSDNIDPREYLARLEMWQGRVEKTGGHWRVINDLDGLDGLL